VSPLWRDEIGVFLAPHKLLLTRQAKGVRARADGEASWNNSFAGDSHWNAALAALDGYLSRPEWQKAAVRVVVADNWVRYAMVPHSDALNGADEKMTHARHVLTGIFGEVVSQWTLTLGDSPPGASRLACAIPTALLEELEFLLARYKLPLRSLQPQLVAAYNHWRGKLPDGDAWFVSIEQGTLAAARLARGGWDRVHSVRIGANWEIELRRLQTFGRLANASTQEGQVYVDAPAGLRDSADKSAAGLIWLDEDQAVKSTSGQLEYLRRQQA